MFSLDGGNKENYENIRKGARWEKVSKNISDFIAANERSNSKIKTSAICMVPPDKSLSTHWFSTEFTDLLQMLDSFSLRHPHNWDGSVDLGLSGPPKYRQISDKLRRIFTDQVCRELLGTLVFLPDGVVTVCCNDLNGRGGFANIMEDDLQDIYFSETRARMISAFKAGQKNKIKLCRYCDGIYNSFPLPEWLLKKLRVFMN